MQEALTSGSAVEAPKTAEEIAAKEAKRAKKRELKLKAKQEAAKKAKQDPLQAKLKGEDPRAAQDPRFKSEAFASIFHNGHEPDSAAWRSGISTKMPTMYNLI